jgi:hypothetical protein
MIVTPLSVVVTSPATVSSQLPPLAAAMSTMTEPGFIAATSAAVSSTGEVRPGMFAVVMTMSAAADCSA